MAGGLFSDEKFAVKEKKDARYEDFSFKKFEKPWKCLKSLHIQNLYMRDVLITFRVAPLTPQELITRVLKHLFNHIISRFLETKRYLCGALPHWPLSSSRHWFYKYLYSKSLKHLITSKFLL